MRTAEGTTKDEKMSEPGYEDTARKLERDVERLMRKTDLSKEEVYAFLCGGYLGPARGSGSERDSAGTGKPRGGD